MAYKKITTNLKKGNDVIRLEKQLNALLYICLNMYLLHETASESKVDNIAFDDGGAGSSFKLVVIGTNYSSGGHDRKLLVGEKNED